MTQCAFKYASGERCGNSTRASELGDTVVWRGECPTEKRGTVRCFKPITKHFKYCHYHRMMMRGEIEPAAPHGYRMEHRLAFSKAREHFIGQFRKKKEQELNR